VTPSPSSRTEQFTFRTTLAVALRFKRVCTAFGVSWTEGLNRAIEAWCELLEPGGK
jgi:hypothetical protein